MEDTLQAFSWKSFTIYVGSKLDGSGNRRVNLERSLRSTKELALIFQTVPNVNSVNNFDALETNIPKTISPGIITQTLNLLPRDKTYVLSVDEKKSSSWTV